MTAIIIIGIIIFIIYASSSKKKPLQQNAAYANSNKRQKSEKEIKEELAQNLLKNIKVTVLKSNNLNNNIDNSIIDVTNESIEKIDSARTSNHLLPYYWENKAITSYNDIYTATKEQRDFYITFKHAFLRNVYIDLRGYTNYAYILLFDLLKEYDRERDIRNLEALIMRLGLFYLNLKNYAESCFLQKT